MGSDNYLIKDWTSLSTQQNWRDICNTIRCLNWQWSSQCCSTFNSGIQYSGTQNQQSNQPGSMSVLVLTDRKFRSIMASSKWHNPERYVLPPPSSHKQMMWASNSDTMLYRFLKYSNCKVSTLSHAPICNPWSIRTVRLSSLSQLSQLPL